jgi:hypothetical protein
MHKIFSIQGGRSSQPFAIHDSVNFHHIHYIPKSKTKHVRNSAQKRHFTNHKFQNLSYIRNFDH